MPLTAARPEVAVVLLIAGSSWGPSRSDPGATECRLRWRPARRVGYGGTDPIPDRSKPRAGRKERRRPAGAGPDAGRTRAARTGPLGHAQTRSRHRVAFRGHLSDGWCPSATRRSTDAVSIAPRAPIGLPHRLGGGDLRVPRREARSLGFDAHGRELCPNALALFPADDPGSGPLCGRARLRSWAR